MHQALARSIPLVVGFVPNFDAGPPAHTVSAVLVLSPAQMWGPAGLDRVLPRGDGVVQAGSDAVQSL